MMGDESLHSTFHSSKSLERMAAQSRAASRAVSRVPSERSLDKVDLSDDKDGMIETSFIQ